MSQVHPVNTFPLCSPNILSDIILPSTPGLQSGLLPAGFINDIYQLSHTCYMTRPSHPRFDHPINIW